MDRKTVEAMIRWSICREDRASMFARGTVGKTEPEVSPQRSTIP